MFVFFMVLALIFLIAGGVGLFYTNINMASGSHLWVQGNITYGTFTAVGALTLFFMAIFGHQID